MKNNRLSILTISTLTAGAMLFATAASAEDLPQIKVRQQFSVTKGFQVSSLAVLQRVSSVNQYAVSASLVQNLRPTGAHNSTFAGERMRTEGDQWWLEVSSDGTAAEYRDLAVADRAHSLGRPLSQQMSASELEQRGRAFIAAHLASQIALGPGEELVALRADYRTDGGQDLTTGAITETVVANRLVFGRTIKGVPVVGNGSKVILTFTNDGALESFHYDWPSYQAGDEQTLAAPAEVLSRLQKVMGAHSGVAAATTRALVPGAGHEYPVVLTPNTQLQALDCGYYDPGSFGRATQSVQPGCTYLSVSQDGAGMRQGFSGAVPAGISFTSDAAWMETQILGRQ